MGFLLVDHLHSRARRECSWLGTACGWRSPHLSIRKPGHKQWEKSAPKPQAMNPLEDLPIREHFHATQGIQSLMKHSLCFSLSRTIQNLLIDASGDSKTTTCGLLLDVAAVISRLSECEGRGWAASFTQSDDRLQASLRFTSKSAQPSEADQCAIILWDRLLLQDNHNWNSPLIDQGNQKDDRIGIDVSSLVLEETGSNQDAIADNPAVFILRTMNDELFGELSFALNQNDVLSQQSNARIGEH